MDLYSLGDPIPKQIQTCIRYYNFDLLCFVVWIFGGYPPRFYYAERMVKKTSFSTAELKRKIDENDKLLLEVQQFLTVRWQLRVVG